MSKAFARDFYDSQKWKARRAFYREYMNGLCEVCGGVGEIVHHIQPLTPENIDDLSITLGIGNLQLLCRSCHKKQHDAQDMSMGYFFDEFGEVHPTGK